LLAALQAIGSAPHLVAVAATVDRQPLSTDERLAQLERYIRALGEQQQIILRLLAQIGAAARIPLG
jgi:hypothetical protein